MKYYVITSAEYSKHTTASSQSPVWSLDDSKCILEVDDSYTITNHLEEFSTAAACNSWRWDTSTEEWRNWASEAYWNGTDLDDF